MRVVGLKLQSAGSYPRASMVGDREWQVRSRCGDPRPECRVVEANLMENEIICAN